MPDDATTTRLFYDALDLDTKHQRAFLDAVCAGRPRLRRRLDLLLDVDAPLVDTPSPDLVQPLALLEGHQIGPYRIHEQIGSGGFSDVYRATEVVAPVKEVPAPDGRTVHVSTPRSRILENAVAQLLRGSDQVLLQNRRTKSLRLADAERPDPAVTFNPDPENINRVAIKILRTRAPDPKRLRADAFSLDDLHPEIRTSTHFPWMKLLPDSLNRALRNSPPVKDYHWATPIDSGTYNERPFFVYQYYPLTLANLIRQGTPFRRNPIVRVLTHRIAALHIRGFLHRDIKPSNIFLTPIGQYRRYSHDFDDDEEYIITMGDYSLLHHVTDTSVPANAGSPGYAAPEVILGDPPDFRTDQYALAATVYVMYQGYPPFQAHDDRLLQRLILHHPPPPVPQRPALSSVLQRAMSKRPEGRFPDLRAFGDAYLAASHDTD